MGSNGTYFPLLRYVAAGHKHGDQRCNVPDGFPDSEYAKSRCGGDATEIERTDSRDVHGPKYDARSGKLHGRRNCRYAGGVCRHSPEDGGPEDFGSKMREPGVTP